MYSTLQAEVIYKGATRPAMKLGVPLVPLVLLFGGAMLAVMWIGPLLTWWVLPAALTAVVPLLAWMRFVTRQDDQRFRQWALCLRLQLRDRNRRFWHARSYAGYPYRGSRHASC